MATASSMVQQQGSYELSCPNYNCKWHGYGYHFQEHLRKCNYQIVQCYCDELMAKGHLVQYHLREECLYRMLVDEREIPKDDERGIHKHGISCCYSHKGCKWIGNQFEKKTAHYQLHKTKKCNHMDIQCLCKMEVQKSKLLNHMESEKECQCFMHYEDGTDFHLDPAEILKQGIRQVAQSGTPSLIPVQLKTHYMCIQETKS